MTGRKRPAARKRAAPQPSHSLRARRAVRLHRWATLNVARGGASLTVGRRGLKVNVGRRGLQITMGVPGSGVSYQWRWPWQWLWGQLKQWHSKGGSR